MNTTPAPVRPLRDPRRIPKIGDTVRVDDDTRQVDCITVDGMGFVHVGWARSASSWGWMRLESWKRWAKKGDVLHAAD